MKKWALVMVGLALSLASPPGFAQVPVYPGRVVRGTLSFDGHATLGDFTGTTDSVRGAMTGGDNLSAVRGWVEAVVATLITGNSKRDRDLRKSMEADSYPTMRFDLTGVTIDSVVSNGVSVTLSGRMTIHGATREVTFPGTVELGRMEIRVRSDFELSLKDYHIRGLSKMLGLLKMHDRIQVHVDLLFRSQPTH